MNNGNYRLKVSDDGRVRYIIRAGKDLVIASTTEDAAEWMMKNKKITRETPTDWPEFQVCADGAYWFEGEWEDEATGNRQQATGITGDTGGRDRSIFEEAETPSVSASAATFPKGEGKKNRKRGD